MPTRTRTPLYPYFKSNDNVADLFVQTAQVNDTSAVPTAGTPPPRTSTPVPNGVPLTGATPGTPGAAPNQPTSPFPEKAAPHGAPVRQWLNQTVIPALLEGMKMLAADR